MKRSITRKLFITVFVVFIAVLTIQGVVLSRYFETAYRRSMMSTQRDQLHSLVQDFRNEESAGTALGKYRMETGASAIILSDDGRIADGDFLKSMGYVTVRLKDSGTITIPMIAMADMGELPKFIKGKHISLEAVRLGESDYAQPLSIVIGGISYTDAGAVREYKQDASIDKIRDYGQISQISYSINEKDCEDVLFLYETIRESLIRGESPESFISEKNGIVREQNGNQLALYAEKCSTGKTDYYFITAREIVITGQEKTYLNRFFYPLYLILGCVLLLAAWWLSRSISKPLLHLSDVTKKLAKLDFSQYASVRGNDELASLSENINIMADSLKESVSELKLTAERASDNEKRMKLLLNDLAHEFKTPLFIISSYTEALEMGLSGEDTEKYYSVIGSEVEKLSEMVSEVIELSKMESGNWKVDIQKWDLRDVIQSTVEKFDKQFANSGFNVDCNIGDAWVYMDARRIEQVISNFFSNAIKYSDERKELRVYMEESGNGEITVWIGNSGFLSEEDKERIWERYYHGSEGSVMRLPSEGIGLDIVRTILRAHDSTYGNIQKDGMVYFYFSLKKA